jgi:hypothetical protein
MPHSPITVDWSEYDRLRHVEGFSLFFVSRGWTIEEGEHHG